MGFESGVFPPNFMDKAFATHFTPAPFTRKAAARTALVGLDEPARALLAEGFRQFGIETVVVTADAAERLKKEKFEACVLSLGEGAGSVMEAARSSPSNSRCVIYGVGGNAQEAMSYSKYGINAMFNEPLERPAALKLIRATRLLVLHEFRRYVRIPVMTAVSLVGDGRRIAASSIEISSGGMSVKSCRRFFHRRECGGFLRADDLAPRQSQRGRELVQAQVDRSALRLRRRPPPEDQDLDRFVPGKLRPTGLNVLCYDFRCAAAETLSRKCARPVLR